ncbi:MAG: DUF2283 domain-containing protein [Acidobacteriota bacterium]
METIKIPKNGINVNWSYNEEADVLYLSIGMPRTAICIDIDEGLVVHYNEADKKVVGLTLIGLRTKALKITGKTTASAQEDNILSDIEHIAEEDAEWAIYGKQLFDQGGEA